MDKSHRNRFRMRNFDKLFTLNTLPDIIRCTKCTRYNNINHQIKTNFCSFCGNPIEINKKM